MAVDGSPPPNRPPLGGGAQRTDHGGSFSSPACPVPAGGKGAGGSAATAPLRKDHSDSFPSPGGGEVRGRGNARATFHGLLTPTGQALLAQVTVLPDLSEATYLRHLTALRRHHDADLVRLALDTALLRVRATAKFSRAADMYFTRPALEQATGEIVARYRAQRFVGLSSVADLGCGIGGDTIALAGVAPSVIAVDRDPLRLMMTRANAAAYQVGGTVHMVQADMRRPGLRGLDAIFCDPARRTAEGRRVFDLDAYEPPLREIMAWRAEVPALAVKLGPGVNLDALEQRAPDSEVEFISVDGDLREGVIWCGPLRTTHRRATVLTRSPDVPTIINAVETDMHGRSATLTGDPDERPRVAAPRCYLLDPDPAVYRANLLGTLAAQIDATQIDATIAYLTSDRVPDSPFVRTWLIDEVLPFNVKGLRQRLRALNVGQVVIKKRGSPLDPQELEKMLRLDGTESRTIVLTRVAGQHVAILCRPMSGKLS